MELTLHFAGVLQSWGIPEFHMEQRRTNNEPTHSGVCGLIGNALGLVREDEEELNEIKEKVSIVSIKAKNKIHKMTDDQIVGFGYGRDKRENAKGKMTSDSYPQVQKEYIEDNDFTVVISGEDSFMEKVKEALMNPKRPLHLGRKCCTGYKSIIGEEE